MEAKYGLKMTAITRKQMYDNEVEQDSRRHWEEYKPTWFKHIATVLEFENDDIYSPEYFISADYISRNEALITIDGVPFYCTKDDRKPVIYLAKKCEICGEYMRNESIYSLVKLGKMITETQPKTCSTCRYSI